MLTSPRCPSSLGYLKWYPQNLWPCTGASGRSKYNWRNVQLGGAFSEAGGLTLLSTSTPAPTSFGVPSYSMIAWRWNFSCSLLMAAFCCFCALMAWPTPMTVGMAVMARRPITMLKMFWRTFLPCLLGDCDLEIMPVSGPGFPPATPVHTDVASLLRTRMPSRLSMLHRDQVPTSSGQSFFHEGDSFCVIT